MPQNDGCFRPVKVIAPKERSITLRFRAPASHDSASASGSSTTRSLRFPTRSQSRQQRANSAGVHFCSYAGFVEETGQYWIYIEVNEGSYGGRYGKDAMDSVDN